MADAKMDYLFHHLFLPPKLPGEDDSSGTNEEHVINVVRDALARFIGESDQENGTAIRACMLMMDGMRTSRDFNGYLMEAGVQKALQNLGSQERSVALFYISAQNAGVLMRRITDAVCCETFELSPENHAVFGTTGRLVRHFPATAIEIPLEEFRDDRFQSVLAKTLAKMSHQPVKGTKKQVRKAKQDHDEDRDTTDPRIVTELLMSILRGCGKPVVATGVCKNTHEEVMWTNSELPWRRSPLWLLIRVGLQLTMNRLGVGSKDLYKHFMPFLLAQVLDLANQQQTPSDVLHTMMIKVARRLRKLQSPPHGRFLSTIKEIVSKTSQTLTQRWTLIRRQLELPIDLEAVSRLEMKDNIYFKLTDLETFVRSIPLRENESQSSPFQPVSHDWNASMFSLPSIGPVGFGSGADHLPYNLAGVESWIEFSLQKWLEHNIHDGDCCENLAHLLQDYHSAARSWYASRPEGASKMLLTIGELWVALDKAAIQAIPMIRDYSPEVPTEVWQALLLGPETDMERLYRVENYLLQRHQHAKEVRPSIFRSYGENLSFPVMYFSSSTSHHDLKARIERKATEEREAKCEEFRQLQARYRSLMQQHIDSECEFYSTEEYGVYISKHSSGCRSCALLRSANNLTIQIHEWPLPQDDLKAQATAFELDVPPSFAAWRDVTVYLLHNVLRCESEKSQPSASTYSLRTYEGLAGFAKGGKKHRIHLLSISKPHVVTHRRGKPVSSSLESDVCVNNGLRYQYFDESQHSFVTEFTPSLHLTELCTFNLPIRAQVMRRFLERSWKNPDGETPNQVIASQSSCPEYMQLGEYKALAVLPYGYRILWMNILIQLAMPTVDFNKPETTIFLLQITLQAGPYSDADCLRHTHIQASDTRFKSKMLQNLNTCISRIQENWESHTALCSFTILATRLLSLSGFTDLRSLLQKSREISHRWLNKLVDKIQETTDDDQRAEFQETAFMIALICAESFNVNLFSMSKILLDSQQASILVEVAIFISNNMSMGRGSENHLRDIMLDRWRRTMQCASGLFRILVMDKGDPCVDLAIRRIWPDFEPEGGWSLLPPVRNWFETTSLGLTVHLNILTGELLVNGLPLSRLPGAYGQHSDYEKLFGFLVLNVMPSGQPGMHFRTTKLFHQHDVHFGMQPASGESPIHDILVRIKKDGQTHDLVPPRAFKGLLPHSFVNEYVHWYDNATEIIEFRPLKNPWCASSNNWRLSKQGHRWTLSRKDKVFHLAPSSPLAQRLAGILSPLESPLNLHMLYDRALRTLEVQMPRLQLEFLLKSGESSLRSRQFRAMEIDADQSVGTLVGLMSKLVLRNKDDAQMRMLIIPEGNIEYQKWTGRTLGDHVKVSVTHGTASRVQAYRIDNLLGRLIINGKMESKLHLAYLHALTSFCLPDPFLNRTGTEAAFEILRSASVRAPCSLSQVAHNRLILIASLAPGRSFYPEYERVMQDVRWSSHLSYLSQDDRFYKVTEEILERCREIAFLYPKNDVVLAQPTRTTVKLVERAILQTSRHHVSGFGAEDFQTGHDARYESRDSKRSDRAIRATELAFRVHTNRQSLFQPVSSGLAVHLYNILSSQKTSVCRANPPKSDMEYDSKWLQSPSAFLSSYWGRLHFAFRDNPRWLNKYALMVWISTISYSDANDPNVTQALLLLALSPFVAATTLPKVGSYKLTEGYRINAYTVQSHAEDAALPFESCPEASLPRLYYESAQDTAYRRKRTFELNRYSATKSFRDNLVSQWPRKFPILPHEPEIGRYINVARALIPVTAPWTNWYENLQFKNYLQEFVDKLDCIPVQSITIEPPEKPIYEATSPSQGFVLLEHLFLGDPPLRLLHPDLRLDTDDFLQAITKSTDTSEKFSSVLSFLDSKAKLGYERRYLRELRQSLESLRDHTGNELDRGRLLTHGAVFRRHLGNCQAIVKHIYDSLSQAVQPSPGQASLEVSEVVDSILIDAGVWPKVSPLCLLQQLRSSRWDHIRASWKTALVEYGLAITILQQAKRFVRFQYDHVGLLRELENTGPRYWDPFDHPEWLLLECESEIRIREVQQQIAQQMINPPSMQNAVMQLNMGEGKSAVIVPIVATALGDGSKLVRVIVAKPQAKQMYQMLVSKLAGQLDRPVYQMPFSRDIRMNTQMAEVIHRLTRRCMEEGGVLLVQPEHLLSFQLMELECRLAGHHPAADKMMDIHNFFDSSSRDVVDESDENFSVKFELIYTLGQQQPIEHSPDRWTVIQEVINLVRRFCSDAKQKFPQSVEFDDHRKERFPKIRILRPDAEQAVFNDVARFVCETGMTGFPISRQPPRIRDAALRYITQWTLSTEEIEAVEGSVFWRQTTMNHILLLRGLLAGGILAFAFGQKRWRVNYGTDPNRETKTKLTVPFRAKDNPTPRSEFSHPDVVIVLTCLSYYYSGLEDEALFSALELLVRSDNAALEYHAWVETAPTLPQAFKHMEGVNLRDRVQCISDIFPHLRYSKAAIDYYLSRMVFAKESREFPDKFSASGWDLSKSKNNPTTGFSGTNDSRYVLPLDMKQLDLPEQKHTNALVLEHLLRPENGIALMPQEMKAATFDSQSLLQMVENMSDKTRVILDVGAQVIDLTNLELAREWLKCRSDDEHTQAVIFFNDLDEIVVLDRSGKVEELQTSPFADQLDQCLVFLDEAHTRGTDLKLPADYQAAVTLGANLTKDRLVQACMRMRKLGKGQTVMFCIPREIEHKILQLMGHQIPSKAKIAVSDVLCWVITETCHDLRRAVPLWLNQGVRFCQQQAHWDGMGSTSDHTERLTWARRFREAEARSLGERYSPHQARSDVGSLLSRVGVTVASEFQRRCEEFGLFELRSSSLQEEQERELSPETEQERQVEKPPPAEPAVHRIHQGLRDFINRGEFSGAQGGFRPAFNALHATSAANHFNVHEFPKNIWVTDDFAKTIRTNFGSGNYSDSFQRPVQWILTNMFQPSGAVLVVISPYEAQHLLPDIALSSNVTLRLYSPRVNLGFEPLDHLNLYTVPSRPVPEVIPKSLISHLNLFAGQLYLSSFDDYIHLCDSLGLAWRPADDWVVLEPDGFIPPDLQGGEILNTSGFAKSPVRFLKVLMSKIRHECELMEKTHMGRILDGVRLLKIDFVED
ncbi:hypothetical protein ACHAPT_013033 [Fusarium lateritium]